MKKFILKISAFACVMLLLLTVTFSTSCKKDKTTHGKVTVVDSANVPVSAAKVLLAAPSANGQKSYTGTTDGSGLASFDIPLPAIWDVTVTKGLLTGTGILRLDTDQLGKTVTTTIIVH
jgi:hypothetical protein